MLIYGVAILIVGIYLADIDASEKVHEIMKKPKAIRYLFIVFHVDIYFFVGRKGECEVNIGMRKCFLEDIDIKV